MATQTPEQSALFQKILDLQNQESTYGPKIFQLYQSGDISGGDKLKAEKDAITSQINALNTEYAQLPTKVMPETDNTPATTASSTTETKIVDNPNLGTNPSGNPGPNTQVFDDGSTLQTFDDGSTLATATDGAVTSTPSPDTKSIPLAQAETELKTAQTAVDEARMAANTASANLEEAQKQLTSAEESLAAAEKTRQDRVDYRNQLLMEGGDTAEIDALISESDTQIETLKQDVANAKDAVDTNQSIYSDKQDALQAAESALTVAQDNVDLARSAGGSAEGVTNPAAADNGKGEIDSSSAAKDQKSRGLTLNGIKSFFGFGGAGGARPPLNSVPGKPTTTVAGFGASQDMRVKLRIPSNYLVGPASGPNGILGQLGGILFPYTPQVSITNQATYQQSKVTHSNYPFYNFQNSSVGPISVAGKFTAQNEYEAAIILSVQHVLRALTKMKWGDDQNAGAPPPICRFDAFGDYQMKNIPVAVSDFKVELPDQVDYIAVGRGVTGWGNTMVPTSCTISITLNVMYSRQEAQYYGVDKWLQGQLAGKGYL